MDAVCRCSFIIHAVQLCRHRSAKHLSTQSSNALQGVFLMEGMWSRFFPAEQALRSLLQRGAIGEPLQADARFTFAGSKVRADVTAATTEAQSTRECIRVFGQSVHSILTTRWQATRGMLVGTP